MPLCLRGQRLFSKVSRSGMCWRNHGATRLGGNGSNFVRIDRFKSSKSSMWCLLYLRNLCSRVAYCHCVVFSRHRTISAIMLPLHQQLARLKRGKICSKVSKSNEQKKSWRNKSEKIIMCKLVSMRLKNISKNSTCPIDGYGFPGLFLRIASKYPSNLKTSARTGRKNVHINQICGLRLRIALLMAE